VVILAADRSGAGVKLLRVPLFADALAARCIASGTLWSDSRRGGIAPRRRCVSPFAHSLGAPFLFMSLACVARLVFESGRPIARVAG
jgi:hypothetical protein